MNNYTINSFSTPTNTTFCPSDILQRKWRLGSVTISYDHFSAAIHRLIFSSNSNWIEDNVVGNR
jgi:hypothetical protein